MRMFQSRKTKEYITPEYTKDWSNAGYELEYIGNRLDAVREILAELGPVGKKKKPTWAQRHWSQVENNLLTRWHMTLMLKDTGLKQIGRMNKYSIDRDWWEGSEEIKMNLPVFSIFDNMFDNLGLQHRLEESWAKAQELKVQKARQGLA